MQPPNISADDLSFPVQNIQLFFTVQNIQLFFTVQPPDEVVLRARLQLRCEGDDGGGQTHQVQVRTRLLLQVLGEVARSS